MYISCGSIASASFRLVFFRLRPVPTAETVAAVVGTAEIGLCMGIQWLELRQLQHIILMFNCFSNHVELKMEPFVMTFCKFFVKEQMQQEPTPQTAVFYAIGDPLS